MTAEEMRQDKIGSRVSQLDIIVTSVGEIKKALKQLASEEGFSEEVYFDHDGRDISYSAKKSNGAGVGYVALLSEDNPRDAYVFNSE